MGFSKFQRRQRPPAPSLGTKAQTLHSLAPVLRHAAVLPSYFFDVQGWQANPRQQLASIQKQFGTQRLIIRSSTLLEDSVHSSYAGAFRSELNVDGASPPAIIDAVERVIRSYGIKPHGDRGRPRPQPTSPPLGDQVLVQPMLEDIAVSGVMMTHTLNDGAPYYVIHYDDESGKTDTVTGGTCINKTVLLHHQVSPEMITSPRVAQWVGMVRELEGLFPQTPLDIEFAQDKNGQLYLLQVRPMAANRHWNRLLQQEISACQARIQVLMQEQSKVRPGLLGARTMFGDMTDWNPAEMIGSSPRPLAASLYRYLITDTTWREARAQMGYRHPVGESLMVLIGGRPYIDIRNSLNSFLPAALDESIGEKLVNAWLDRLDQHPELHDKVEFEIAHTVLDLDFEDLFAQRYPDLLTPEELETFQTCLKDLTRQCLDISATGTLQQALRTVEDLAERQQNETHLLLIQHSTTDLIYAIRRLLEDCRKNGTEPFAIIARHAFIAESLLRSAVRCSAFSEERLTEWKRSLETLTTEMSRDLAYMQSGKLPAKSFLDKYGHLRPGTYDILSVRYDQRNDLFCPEGAQTTEAPVSSVQPPFQLSREESRILHQCLQKSGLEGLTPGEFLTYCRRAIVGREYAKFVFTRSLSMVLEYFAAWGERLQLSREEVSYLTVPAVLDTLTHPILSDPYTCFKQLCEQGQSAMALTRALRFTYLIRDVRDLYVIPLHRSAPTFVTHQSIEGEIVLLSTQETNPVDLRGKIVCIENADPGFDWIFTRGIAGLVTQYGGSNSHMAIRCTEFQIPAAIGCGEQTFEHLIRCKRMELLCGDKIVRPLYG